MTSEEVIDLLRSRGAIVEGHFALPDGMHTNVRLRPTKASQFAPINRKLCYEIVRHFLELDIHVVIAATTDSIPFAVEVGRQLEARCIFVAPATGTATLFDGFELHEGERAVVLQSLLPTDAEIDAVAGLLRAANARLIGVGSLLDARATRRRFTVKDVAAAQLVPPHYAPESCPLCAAGIPLEA